MYDPRIQDRRLSFGVSGLLWKRNLLFYDRETDSLWSQLLGRAVAGPLAGTPVDEVAILPSMQPTWSAWKKQHPATLVLSFQTGYPMDYGRDPYEGFPLDRTPALVVSLGGKTRIYPFRELKKVGRILRDSLAGKEITIEFDEREGQAAARRTNGAAVASFVAFLPDARAFYPKAEVFRHRQEARR